MTNPWNQWGGGSTAFVPSPYGPYAPGFDPRGLGPDSIEESLMEAERYARGFAGPRGFVPMDQGPLGVPFGPGFGPRPLVGPHPIPPLGGPVPGFAPEDYRLDPRMILEEIRRCGRGLQSVADELDGPDTPAQYKAHLIATRHLFYALGMLFNRGIILPPEIAPVEKTDRSITRASSCKAAGQAIEKYVRQQLGARGAGNEVADLVARLRDCWDQLTKI
jgi:hypothetical protein